MRGGIQAKKGMKYEWEDSRGYGSVSLKDDLSHKKGYGGSHWRDV